jgi:hypothetical protein
LDSTGEKTVIGTVKKTTVLMMLLSGLASASALRADDGSLSVSPSVVMLRGEAGQTTTQILTFTNGTSQPLSFEMKAQDAVVRGGKRLFVEAGTLPGSIAATAAFSPKLFTVAARQNFSVDVTVTIPPKPPVRAIAVMFEGTTKLGNGPLKMTASVGTLLTFALAGDVIAASASPLIVQAPTASSNFVAAQQVSNTGTEPMEVTGMLAIVDATGTLVGTQAIPVWRMLPGERTDIRVEYAGNLPSGSYKTLVTYDLTDKTLTSSAEFKVR